MSEDHEGHGEVEKSEEECADEDHSVVWTIRMLYFIGFIVSPRA